MFGPGAGKGFVILGLGQLDFDATCVQEGLIEIVPRGKCLFFIFEANEAELARLPVFEHDFSISDAAALSPEVIGKVNFLQVLWNVFDH